MRGVGEAEEMESDGQENGDDVDGKPSVGVIASIVAVKPSEQPLLIPNSLGG